MGDNDRYIVPSEPKHQFKLDQKNDSITFRQGLKKHFQDYCSTSTIHGLAYFSEERTWIEYIWWIIVFALSMCGSLYMISEIYLKWLNSPVLVSFATVNTPIYEIPFPAVTICPQTKLHRDAVNITELKMQIERNETLTEEKNFYRDYVEKMCDYSFKYKKYFTPLTENYYTYLKKGLPKRKFIVKYMDQYLNFDDVFTHTITEEGLCYTFNRLRLDQIFRKSVVLDIEDKLNYSDWHINTGYQGAGLFTYPRRALLSGTKNALKVMIIDDIRDVDHYCRSSLQGYSISIHLPQRIPKTANEFFFLPLDDELFGQLKASVVLNSNKVKEYPPYKRDCYFTDEKYLRYFRRYTQKNCEIECTTNITLKRCGCVEFHMPREKGTKICGTSKSDCVKKADRDSHIGWLEHKLGITEDTENCNCLAMCTDINYSAEAAPLHMDKNKLMDEKFSSAELKEYFNLTDLTELQQSFLFLYFKDSSLTTTERNELYGPTDFLSNFGGLLGLFTGFSILSCLEIIYFCTLRVFGNIRLFGHWAGPPN